MSSRLLGREIRDGVGSEPWTDAGTIAAWIPEDYLPELPAHVRRARVHWRPLEPAASGTYAAIVELLRIEFPTTNRILDGSGLLLRWTMEPLPGDAEAALAARNHAKLRKHAVEDAHWRSADGVVVPVLYLEGRDGVRRWALSVVERATGGSLLDAVGWHPTPPEQPLEAPWSHGIGFREAARLLAPVAGAVLSLHGDEGETHRDLSLGNIVLRREISSRAPAGAELDDQAALIDFDLLRPVRRDGPIVTRQYATPDFLPPELDSWQPGRPLDGRKIDVWQMTMVWCLVATGVSPFQGDKAERQLRSLVGVPDRDEFVERAGDELEEGAGQLARFLDPDPRTRANALDLRIAMRELAELPEPPEPSVALEQSRHALVERLATALDPRRVVPRWWSEAPLWTSWAAASAVIAGLFGWRVAGPWAVPLRSWTLLERVTILVAVLAAVGGTAVAFGVQGWRAHVTRGRPASDLGIWLLLIAAIPAAGSLLLTTRITDGATLLPLGVLVLLWVTAGLGIWAVAGRVAAGGWSVGTRLLLAGGVVVPGVLGLSAVRGSWWRVWAFVTGPWGVAVGAILVVVGLTLWLTNRRSARERGHRPGNRLLAHLAAAAAVVALVLTAAPTSWAHTWSSTPVEPAQEPVWQRDLVGVGDNRRVDPSVTYPPSGRPAGGAIDAVVDPAGSVDERNYAKVRPSAGGAWADAVRAAKAGDEYQLRLSVRNDAAVPSGSGSGGTVTGLRLRLDVPSADEKSAAVRPRLAWAGGPSLATGPSDPVPFSGPRPFSLELVSGSAQLSAGSGTDTTTLPDEVTAATGTFLGSPAGSGQLAAGGTLTVTALIRVVAPSAAISTVVSTASGGKWLGTAELAADGQARIGVYYRNDSLVQRESVQVHVTLPEGLLYVPSSTSLFDALGASAIREPETLTGRAGLELGPRLPGSGVWVVFSVSVDASAPCGDQWLSPDVAVQAAGRTTHSTVDILVHAPACGT